MSDGKFDTMAWRNHEITAARIAEATRQLCRIRGVEVTPEHVSHYANLIQLHAQIEAAWGEACLNGTLLPGAARDETDGTGKTNVLLDPGAVVTFEGPMGSAAPPPADTIETRRRGYFEIVNGFTADLAFTRAVADIEVEHTWDIVERDCKRYLGRSRHFDALAPGEAVPNYDCIVSRTDGGPTITWRRRR